MSGYAALFGSNCRLKKTDSSFFYCPLCNNEAEYIQYSVRMWFNFMYMPILPMNWVGNIVQCQNCQNDLKDTVLLMQSRLRRLGEYELEMEKGRYYSNLRSNSPKTLNVF